MSGTYIPPVDQTHTQHDGTSHLAIRNSFLRRYLILLALKTTSRFFKRDGPCVPISKTLIVKTSPFVHLTEAATMQYIAANTSVPVPRVYCSFVHRNQAYIAMERISGQSFPEAWKTFTKKDLVNIYAQLQRIFRELRALPPPPGGGVQSCSGGSLRDSRIPRSRPRFGPFSTIQDFHLWLREGLLPEDYPNRENDEDWLDIKKMVAKHDGPWAAPVFTHGDMNPFNIMIRDGNVVGIIDWEFSGWYPTYWEYTSAWYGSLTRQSWQSSIAEFLETFSKELEMEITRQKWWGEY